jgi:seryl-tRNA synthetase
MLNGTLCATQRALCCLVENHQTAEVGRPQCLQRTQELTGAQGVAIPEALRPYMGGRELLPWVRELPKGLQKKLV